MHESFFDVLHIGVNENFLNSFEDYAKHDKPSIQSIHLQKILFSANHFTLKLFDFELTSDFIFQRAHFKSKIFGNNLVASQISQKRMTVK